MPDFIFVPSVIAYAAGIRRQTGIEELIICRAKSGKWFNTDFVDFSEKNFHITGGGNIGEELENYIHKSQTDDQIALLLWNHEASFHWNISSDTSAIFLADILARYSDRIHVYFMGDGWVGEAWDSSLILRWSQEVGLPVSSITHLSLRGSAADHEFNKAGISTIVAGKDACSTALRVCSNYSKSLLDNNIKQLAYAAGENPLVIVMRPWFNADFHNGKYNFGSADPLASASALISSVVESLKLEANLPPLTSVLLCPDARTEKYYASCKLQETLAPKLEIEVLNLQSFMPENTNTCYFMTLDYILPSLMDDLNIVLYCFDSNTTIPMHMAGLNFVSIHGGPNDLLRSYGATNESLDYISANVKRISSYASPEYYTSLESSSGLVIISPSQVM